MNRREVLKAFGITVAATASSAAFAQPAPNKLSNRLLEYVPDPKRIPAPPTGATSVEAAPERLLAAEPQAALSKDGKLSILFSTVVPTQNFVVYVGVPNSDQKLEYPLYVTSAVTTENAPATDHRGGLDLVAFLKRFVAEYIDASGGVLHYRIEIMDPRKSAIRFIDRAFNFKIENGEYRVSLTITDGPFVTQTTKNSAVVWWETDKPGTGSVQVGGQTVNATAQGRRQIARISGLEAGRTYAYTVSSRADTDSVTAREYSFRTEPNGDGFSFAFTCDGRTGSLGGGDTALEGINGEAARALTGGMLTKAPDFLVFTGDLISGYTTSEADFRAQLKSWKRLTGKAGRYIPIYTTMGNHESLLDNFSDGSSMDKKGDQSASVVFASEFVNPDNGPEPEGPGLPPYKGAVYSWDYAGSHFVQLNSDYWYSSDPVKLGGNYFGRLLEGQLKWLEADLQAARAANAKHIFVFVHQPPFPNGGHVQDALWGGGKDADAVTVRDRFWKVITDAGVLAVFSGHEHNYSRVLMTPQTPGHWDGTPIAGIKNSAWAIIQGAAGAPFYLRDKTVPWVGAVKKFIAHNWAYSRVVVRGERVDLETYSYTGELVDSAQLAPIPQ
jgi:hypothetical protein